MSENAEHGQLLELTARIVAAHVGHNEVAPAALPELIRIVHATLAGAGKPAEVAEKPQPAVPVKKSVFPDFIVCLEDGKKLKMLKRHLQTSSLTRWKTSGACLTITRCAHPATQSRFDAMGKSSRPRQKAARYCPRPARWSGRQGHAHQASIRSNRRPGQEAPR